MKRGFTGAFLNASNLTVPGSTFPQCSWNYVVSNNLLTNATTTAAWISGGDGSTNANAPATYIATNVLTLEFANGKVSTLAATGKFNMYRPVANIYPVTGGVQIITNADGSSPMLSLGNASGTQPGMRFDYSISYPSNFPGTNFWIQILTSSGTERQYVTNGTTFHSVENGPGPPFLDDSPTNISPDPYPYTLNNGTEPFDSPSIGLTNNWTSASVKHESFEMTIMLKGPVPVPLVTLPWNWSGTAIYNTNTSSWTIYPYDSTVETKPLIRSPGYPIWGSFATDYSWTNTPLENEAILFTTYSAGILPVFRSTTSNNRLGAANK
jgi:hypothetical protein